MNTDMYGQDPEEDPLQGQVYEKISDTAPEGEKISYDDESRFDYNLSVIELYATCKETNKKMFVHYVPRKKFPIDFYLNDLHHP